MSPVIVRKALLLVGVTKSRVCLMGERRKRRGMVQVAGGKLSHVPQKDKLYPTKAGDTRNGQPQIGKSEGFLAQVTATQHPHGL